jgi:nitroreductase
MDVIEAIKGRRSIRSYVDKPVPKELIGQVLEAAEWAPSASNQQRWRFIVVTQHSTKELIRQASPGIFAGPPVYIVICAEEGSDATDWDRATYLADCSMAAQNIMLAAHSLGLGTCVVLSFSPPAVQEILELPEDIKPVLVVTLGYPGKQPAVPARLPLQQIAFEEEYGEAWNQ